MRFCKKGVGTLASERISGLFFEMKNNDYLTNDNTKWNEMEYAILMSINQKMFSEGIITREEKEAIDMEILREK